MSWIAWKILTGDRKKYVVIVFGVAFASLLIGHQASVFFGAMRRTTSQIWDYSPPEFGLWIPKPSTSKRSGPSVRTNYTACVAFPGSPGPPRFSKGPCGREPKAEGTGWDSNPRCRITGAESWPLDDQCLLSVGSEGLEPSLARVRTECAAANTLIPRILLADRPGRSRTLVWPL